MKDELPEKLQSLSEYDKVQLRKKCLRLATECNWNLEKPTESIIIMADEFYNYIKEGKKNDNS